MYINHYRPIVVVWYISLVLEYIPFILLCSLFKNRRVTHGVSNYRLSHLLLSVSCWFDLPGCFASRCIVGHSSDVEHWLVGRVVRFLSRHLCTTSTLKFIPFFCADTQTLRLLVTILPCLSVHSRLFVAKKVQVKGREGKKASPRPTNGKDGLHIKVW